MKYSIVHVGEHAGTAANIPTLRVLIAIVDSESAISGTGDAIIRKLQKHFPTVPIMLVAIADHGFRAYAHFETHTILAYLQIPLIEWSEIDPGAPSPEEELSF